MPLNLSITSEEKILVTLNPVTAAGNPATLDGAALFTVTSGDATIEPIDAVSAYVISGSIGGSTIEVSGDADLGAGVKTLTDSISLNVVAPGAVGLGLTAGTAVPK